VVGGLFLVLGAALLIPMAWLPTLARTSRSWTSAPGQIVSSKIDVVYRSRHSSSLFRVAVRYQYRVERDTLTGRRIAFGDRFWSSFQSQSQAEAARQAYPEGKDVTVFYDPARPARCTLDRNLDRGRYFRLTAAAVGLLAAGAAVLTGHIQVVR